jgi:hypothetical protein
VVHVFKIVWNVNKLAWGNLIAHTSVGKIVHRGSRGSSKCNPLYDEGRLVSIGQFFLYEDGLFDAISEVKYT